MKMEIYAKEPFPVKMRLMKGDRERPKDPRSSILYDKTTGCLNIEVKKCKTQDESKYTIEILDAAEKVIDFAGFSVFVKGKYLFYFILWDVKICCLYAHLRLIVKQNELKTFVKMLYTIFCRSKRLWSRFQKSLEAQVG